MLHKHIESQIIEKLGHEPTSGQRILISKLAEFVVGHKTKEAFIIKGYAGTGKTTVIGALIKVLYSNGLNTCMLAPTGRAAKIISSFSGMQANTIHKSIYIQKSAKDGFGKFELNRNLNSSTFFIVDESSMISNQLDDSSIFGTGQLLNDLTTYVYNDKRCKLILVGDTAQLPPIGLNLSPALDSVYFHNIGIDVEEYCLTEVVRQALKSGILFNATTIRDLISSQNLRIPKIKTNGFDDINMVNGPEFLDELTQTYDRDGIENSIVICRSNKRANMYNEGIRKQILFRDGIIEKGDLLMVVKNNYYWPQVYESENFIANGDIGEVIRIKRYIERYGVQFAEIQMAFTDYDVPEMDLLVMLDTLTVEAPAMPYDKYKELFYLIAEDYKDCKTKSLQYKRTREDAYFNALQVKYAYAVTCHKAQGGQWENVFVDQGWFNDQMFNIEYLRWLYTAFTRARKKLYLVGFHKDFLG